MENEFVDMKPKRDEGTFWVKVWVGMAVLLIFVFLCLEGWRQFRQRQRIEKARLTAEEQKKLKEEIGWSRCKIVDQDARVIVAADNKMAVVAFTVSVRASKQIENTYECQIRASGVASTVVFVEDSRSAWRGDKGQGLDGENVQSLVPFK